MDGDILLASPTADVSFMAPAVAVNVASRMPSDGPEPGKAGKGFPRGTQLRQWATERLCEFLVKGVTLDDEHLKRGADDCYFEELLARIRDIRSSEKMCWRKVLDIYATSVDYDASAEASQTKFLVQKNGLRKPHCSASTRSSDCANTQTMAMPPE